MLVQVTWRSNHNIIVLCEQWLWPFELHKINDIHPNMVGLATAEKRLNPNSNLVRGSIQTAIWSEAAVVLALCGTKRSMLYLFQELTQTEYAL